MSTTVKWADLRARVASGLVLAVIGLAGIWLGGLWFMALASIVAGIMVWELAAMIGIGVYAIPLGILGAVVEAMSIHTPGPLTLISLLAPPLAGFAAARHEKSVFLLYCFGILLSCHLIAGFREWFGLLWIAWLVLVVVATDIAGYFAGRMFGGPKFWPRVSPKKTWSGTVAGWVAAAIVGLAFSRFVGAGIELVLVSAILSFASQIGDIAESWIKRLSGVKDSSNLIPGHGGLMDRFDGLMGAALAVGLIAEVVMVPMAGF